MIGASDQGRNVHALDSPRPHVANRCGDVDGNPGSAAGLRCRTAGRRLPQGLGAAGRSEPARRQPDPDPLQHAGRNPVPLPGVDYRSTDGTLQIAIRRCGIKDSGCTVTAKATSPKDDPWRPVVVLPYRGEKIMMMYSDGQQQVVPAPPATGSR